MGAYSRVGTYKLFGLSGWAVNRINKVTWTSKSVIKSPVDLRLLKALFSLDRYTAALFFRAVSIALLFVLVFSRPTM